MIKIFFIFLFWSLTFLVWLMVTVKVEYHESYYVTENQTEVTEIPKHPTEPPRKKYTLKDFESGLRITKRNLFREFQGLSFKMLNNSGKIGSDVDHEHVKNILIVTSVRSGSSFLGELLNQYPGTFFYFEPLHYHSFHRQDDNVIQSRDLLESLFWCNFTQETQGFLDHAKAHPFLFNRQSPKRLWSSCSSFKKPKENICFSREYLNKVCPQYPIRLIKTVRMRIKETEELIRSLPNLKIIVLVRDPRAVFNSRWSDAISKWCKSEHCSDPETSCRDLEEDLIHTKRLMEAYSDKIMLVRYEDLSLYTMSSLKSMLEFLELPWQAKFQQYITSHTKMEKMVRSKGKMLKRKDPYSTTRNSTAAVMSWVSSLSTEDVTRIQSSCSAPMDTLGYKPVSPEHLRVSSSTLEDIVVLGKQWSLQP